MKFRTINGRKVPIDPNPIRIGDTVKTGLGTGRVTYIRNDYATQKPEQFKVEITKGLGKGSSAKFHNKVQLIKRAKS